MAAAAAATAATATEEILVRAKFNIGGAGAREKGIKKGEEGGQNLITLKARGGGEESLSSPLCVCV